LSKYRFANGSLYVVKYISSIRPHTLVAQGLTDIHRAIGKTILAAAMRQVLVEFACFRHKAQVKHVRRTNKITAAANVCGLQLLVSEALGY
jgi:hypothetical protein